MTNKKDALSFNYEWLHSLRDSETLEQGEAQAAAKVSELSIPDQLRIFHESLHLLEKLRERREEIQMMMLDLADTIELAELTPEEQETYQLTGSAWMKEYPLEPEESDDA